MRAVLKMGMGLAALLSRLRKGMILKPMRS